MSWEEFLHETASPKTKLLRILKGIILARRLRTSGEFSGGKPMTTFELGDPVRVVGLPNSELHGLRGRVVQVVHSMQEGQSMRTECAVEIPGKGTRWFLAHHLLKSVPEKWIRFFRYEV